MSLQAISDCRAEANTASPAVRSVYQYSTLRDGSRTRYLVLSVLASFPVIPVHDYLKQIPRKSGELALSGKNWDRVPIDAQSIDAPLSLAAVFLVVTIASEQSALAKVSSVLGGLDDLVKTVGFRDLSGRLSCIAGIGRDLWDRLHSDRRPQELKPFAPIRGTVHGHRQHRATFSSTSDPNVPICALSLNAFCLTVLALA